ncbi:MAG TPA: nodulation protein NfeD [Vicinamibacterales bacterium]|jgi:membrane-bound serine protease (ClpP class)|nr:nodulation protein NfeD [Vicinamibacterales bacterium]
MRVARIALIAMAFVAAVHRLLAQPSAPIVETATVDAIIQPVTADFMRSAIARADADKAALIVFTLHTPGGLLDATRDINNAIISARTPVAVFVGPAGYRAASAGFLITIAADVAAMAPGTHIGAAHPVSGYGETIDPVMAKKMASDAAAYARTLATQRRRNVPLVEQAVTESRSYTEQEAIGATPPLIDLIANDVPDLIRKLDGRTVRRFNGETVTLQLASPVLRTIEMTRAERVLSAIAHPQIAYLLLTLGTLGLTIELWSPGAILPGVAGGICLLLAFFALQVLPVSYSGVLLILLGFALLVLEVKVTSHGLLAAGGIASLFFGSLMLIDSPLPEMQIGLRVIVPVTLGLAGILLFLVRLGVRAQRQPAVTGESGMLNTAGEAMTSIAPGGVGRVTAHGEIWTATADEPVHAGDRVIITAVKGLLLTVKRM